MFALAVKAVFQNVKPGFAVFAIYRMKRSNTPGRTNDMLPL